jgi:catechol 2,3-dioxygenase-like lactoylglutathione lyase family enzyme
MILARTLSSRFTRSLWRTSAAMVLLLAVPVAAQEQLWIRQLGSTAWDDVYATAPDGAGGAYMAGWTQGNLGGTNAGGGDAWLARYDSAGNRLWIRQLGTPVGDQALAVAPDASGGVYVGGSTWGSLGGPSAGNSDAWLARYDGAGTQLWIRQLGTSEYDIVWVAAEDGSGGSYVAGSTVGNLGGHYLGGGGDAWLARYDSAGNQLWIRQLGTSNYDAVYTAEPDGAGGLYVGGRTEGSLVGLGAGGWDAWLARYDSAGSQLWIRQLGTSGNEDAQAIALDGPNGGVYLGGYTNGSLGAPNVGHFDAWLARFDKLGNQIWMRQLGTSTYDILTAAEPDGSGGVYIGGATSGSLGALNGGEDDAWLAHYDSAGNQLGIDQLGASGSDWVRAASTDGSGGVYVAGKTSSSLGGPNAGGNDAWLARYDDPCGANLNYCTAKANSLNCAPSIATSGTPSASAGSGFSVSATNVLDKQFGLFFYSKSGPASAPFQGGTLCVMPPLVRTPVQNSGGAPPCDGLFTIDFNAYVASGADPALVAGQQVWIQTWSRDPGFAPPDNTSLSDAVSFTLCP